MSRYLLSRAANADLAGIVDCLIENASVDIAERIILQLEEAFLTLAEHPEIGHRREDLIDKPIRFWTVGSHLIAYDPDSFPTAIIRILHHARDAKRILEY